MSTHFGLRFFFEIAIIAFKIIALARKAERESDWPNECHLMN